jgi:hypothetical protein
MKFNHLVAGGIWGGDAVQNLSGVPKSVVVSAMAWVLHTAFGSRTRAPLAILSVSLGFNVPALLPQQGLG